MRPAAAQELARKIDWSALATWLSSFALVAYLGLKGGGYDQLVHDEVGIAVCWALLLFVLVGALPRRALDPLSWLALGLFAAFAVWTSASLGWTESIGNTFADLARLLGYLGLFALALLGLRARDTRMVVGGVAAAIVLVAVVGLLSRLHPSWFPEASQTARFLGETERLSYPIDYWNGLAGLIAIGLPLLLHLAAASRAVAMRGLAAAALPALALTAFLTLSRGGIGAAVVVVGLYLALSDDRLPKLLTLLLASAGSAVLVAAATSRDALQHGSLHELARQQGNELLWITIGVCLAVGVLQAALSSDAITARRPGWTHVPRSSSLAASIVALALVAIVALAVGAPGRVSDGWEEFKEGGGAGSGAGRLGSVAGQSRYQLWSAAVRQNETKPLTGRGAGSFEFWWARDGDTDETVRDTHSLYLQTLGELGVVGLLLLAAFLAAILAGGVRGLLGSGPGERSQVAAAIAGFVAFCATATFDWMWQIPVLPVATLLLGAILLASRPGPRAGSEAGAWRIWWRLAFALAGLAAIVAIAIPLSTARQLRQSEAEVRAGDLAAALSAARTAQNIQPGAAGPRLQEALVLELRGELPAAAAAAREATDRESTNWRTWLVLSRIEAQRGRAAAAVVAFRRARSLNPRSSLFQR